MILQPHRTGYFYLWDCSLILTMIKHIKYEIVFTLHDVATSPNMILRSNIRLSAGLFFHVGNLLNMKVCLHLVILHLVIKVT